MEGFMTKITYMSLDTHGNKRSLGISLVLMCMHDKAHGSGKCVSTFHILLFFIVDVNGVG